MLSAIFGQHKFLKSVAVCEIVCSTNGPELTRLMIHTIMFAEPIQITNHPASQEKKEGARVKLKCKAQGKKKVFYQWLKDGTKMRGQNSSTLALDSVGLCDFGFYSCQVRYADSHGRGVTSYPAIVDIAPRDGMSEFCVRPRPNKFSKHHPTLLNTTLL